MAILGGDFSTRGSPLAASSTEGNVGTLIGATHRFDNYASADLGIGYNWGSIRSAGAKATINTVLTTLGGCYGFSNLKTGPFVTARVDAGFACNCTCRLGGGLGNATGKTNGTFYSGLAGFGGVIRSAPFTFTLQPGIRITGVHLPSFDEAGNKLALNFKAINKTYSSLLFDLGTCIDGCQLGSWTIAPAINLGYELVLVNPMVKSTEMLYGFPVIQYSAFDSRNLTKAGLTVAAKCGAFIVMAEINGLIGDAAKSTSINGQLSINYSF
jgi:hypothetical protein